MKAIVIDHEPASRSALVNLLNYYCPDVVVSGTAQTGTEGLQLAQADHPEIIFLDVEMPDVDGFEVIKNLDDAEASIIFTTTHQQYAVKAFEIGALDFLLKPINIERLLQAIHKVKAYRLTKAKQKQYEILLEAVHQQNSPVSLDARIAFSMLNEIVFSWVRNIVWIEARANMCFIQLSDQPKELFIAKNIGEYVKLFSDYQDLKQVHRSHLVNRNYVKRYLREENAIELSDGKHVPVSVERRHEIMTWLGV